MTSDLVATWTLSLPDGKHKVEFEHGTTSGKRVILVDGAEIHREDWMFKLVGKEHFNVGKAKCTISIDACSGFAYEYTLDVNGKSLEKFSENQSKIQKCWCFTTGSKGSTPYRVVLEKDTLDIWVNGKKMEQMGEFTDEGTETHFVLGDSGRSGCIKAISSGKRRNGLLHKLYIDDNEMEVPEAHE